MPSAYLRLYRGPERVTQEQTSSGTVDEITLPASEILPLLAEAYASRRTWLRDFADDQITVSSDLYEVLVAYQFFRRPSA